MPVRFKGVSEYSNSFKWSPSYRSAQFIPTDEQKASEAGLRSDQMNLLLEPTFTRKRQVPHRYPETQSLMAWTFQDAQGYENDAIASYLDVKTQPPPYKSTGIRKSKTDPKELQNGKPKKSEKSVKEKNDLDISNKNNLVSPKKDSDIQKKHIPQNIQNSVTTNHAQNYIKPDKKSLQPSPQKVQKKEKGDIPPKYKPRKSKFLSAYQTEYQRMYQKPRHFFPSSPLISALDVVHCSSHAIPPYKSKTMQMKSEYDSKFQNMSPMSKSLPLFTSPASPSLKLKVKNFPASPVQQNLCGNNNTSAYSEQFPKRQFPINSQQNLWDDANHNKLNRDLCSFDKAHAVQLPSNDNKCWDILSKSSDTVIEGGLSEGNGSNESIAGSSDPNQPGESLVSLEEDSLNVKDTASITSFVSDNKPLACKLAWGDDSELQTDNECENIQEPKLSKNGYEGRLPTPQLQQIGGALRSHHDLTTPCTGGTLLSSPYQSVQDKTWSPKTQHSSKYLKYDTQSKSTCVQKDVKPEENILTNSKSPKGAQLPQRLHQSPRAPIQGSLRHEEFQHFGKNPRNRKALDVVSLVSSRSSAEQLLERSLLRKDFWRNS